MHRCESFGLEKSVSYTSDLLGQPKLKVVIFAL